VKPRWKEVGLGFLTLLIVSLAVAGVQGFYKKHLPDDVGPLAVALTFLLVYLASVRWVERRRARELAPSPALPELVAGIVTGFAIFSIVMAILSAMGIYHFVGWGTTQGMASALALAVMAGVVEEVLFRGILFRLSTRLIGTWGALVFTSVLFGLAHLGNRGATLGSGIAIMLEAGVLLGAAYALTQRLWLPIGLHIGWNFTEGSVFGMQVSGNGTDAALLRGTVSGASILTGGAFGPESSLVAVLVCFALAVFLLYRTIRLGRIEPGAWSKSSRSTAPVSLAPSN
jgi:membrane protease YdiL (CAAX protease family)